jgi:hypothetical protein
MMEKLEFHNTGGLRDVKERLARASRHPVHADLGREYVDEREERLDQETLGDADDVESRLAQVEPQGDLHVVWNNRDDRRAYVGSERYNLIQHREVVEAIQGAVAETAGSIDKGVVRDYGAHVEGTLVFGDQDRGAIDVRELVGDGYVSPEGSGVARDRLGLGMRFKNSFNGRSGYGGSTMAYRYVCCNWMVWGEETIAETQDYHIKGADDSPGVDQEYFEDVIHEVFDERDELAGIVKDAAEEGEMPIEWTPGVLEQCGFGANYAKRITARVLEQEQPRAGETTAWNVYNAATGHLDNDRAGSLGPERYDHHQGSAWQVLEGEPREPAEQSEDREALEAYVAGVAP